MMKQNIQKEFVDLLMTLFPKKSALANFIADTLFIEKDSAYRRLRGDVQFSLQEAVVLAENLSVSLDKIVGGNGQKKRSLDFSIINYIAPTEIDFRMYKEYNLLLKQIADDSNSEIAMTAKMFPHTLYDSPMLRKFYLMKWIYQYGESTITPKINEIGFDIRLRKLFEEEAELNNSIKTTHLILHKYLILRFVQDIQYFRYLNLIDDASLERLKTEIIETLDHLNRLAAQGVNGKGNKINIYISNLNFDTPTHYIASDKYHLTQIRTFTINDIRTTDSVIFEWAKKYIQSQKKTSQLISTCGDIQRKQFFDEQKALLEMLK